MSIAKRLNAKYGKSKDKLNKDEENILKMFNEWESPDAPFRLSGDSGKKRRRGKK